jgi:hypothetical protein
MDHAEIHDRRARRRYGDSHNDEETAMPQMSDNYERAKTYAEGDIAYGDAAATAQVSAMLAVADEIRALREALESLGRDTQVPR